MKRRRFFCKLRQKVGGGYFLTCRPLTPRESSWQNRLFAWLILLVKKHCRWILERQRKVITALFVKEIWHLEKKKQRNIILYLWCTCDQWWNNANDSRSYCVRWRIFISFRESFFAERWLPTEMAKICEHSRSWRTYDSISGSDKLYIDVYIFLYLYFTFKDLFELSQKTFYDFLLYFPNMSNTVTKSFSRRLANILQQLIQVIKGIYFLFLT